jgi:hypothetical protein
MAIPEELKRLCQVYAENHGIAIAIESPLGFGQDGAVWRSSRGTAIKVFERERNYQFERDCYQRLAAETIEFIGVFDVPKLFAFDDAIHVIEIGIVSPPYLLDFGKAYIDRRPPYTEGQIAESIEESRQLFEEEDWPAVEEAVLDLKLLGIVYLDIKPANIRVR